MTSFVGLEPRLRFRRKGYNQGTRRTVARNRDRHYKAVSFDELLEALSALHNVRDRKQIEEEIAHLLRKHGAARERFQRVEDLLKFLTLMEGLAHRFFESHHGLRAAVELLAQEAE